MGKHVMVRPYRKRRSPLKGCLVALLIFFILGGAAAFAYVKVIERRLRKNGHEFREAQETISNPIAGKPVNFLLLGIDARGEKRARSDTIMLLHLDEAKRRATLISIPRDMRVKIPGKGYDKINAATALGGPALMIRTVEDFTGFSIHHYVLVDFEGFEKMVDALGGIEIYLEKPLVDKATKFGIPAGRQVFDGETALNYVRFRRDPKGDFGRIERQQKFLSALMDKLLRLRMVLKFPKLANIVADNTQTDLTISEMLKFGTLFNSMGKDDVEMTVLPGESKMIGKISYVIPDEENIQKILACVKEGRSLDDLKKQEAGEVPKKDIHIQVLNGCGMAGLAERAKNDLLSKGFTVVGTGNADSFNYASTVVSYRRGEREKAEVVGPLFKEATIKLWTEDLESSVDVVVILGKDYLSVNSR